METRADLDGDVVLTTTLGFTVLHASRDFAMAMVDMVQQVAKLREAVQVLGLPHEMRDAGEARPLVVSKGSIALRDVSFRYPSGQSVLRGFSLNVPGGQKIDSWPLGRRQVHHHCDAAKIVRPDAGEVLIDDQVIAHVTQESLRGSIAVVQQDISLFHRSLLENLRYGRPEATDEEVFRAVDAAGCAEFIAALPDGYETLVGERGMKLSGGQRQRIAIARAFLMNAPIVILDEATSALDTESEQSIQEALARLFRGAR